MKILALDSSGLVASVAIVSDDTLLAEYTVNYKKTHSQTLLPMLDEVAKMIELDLNSVDAIAVAAGPGSFTGCASDRQRKRTRPRARQAAGAYPDGRRTGMQPVWVRESDLPADGCEEKSGIHRDLHIEDGELRIIKEQSPMAVEQIAEELNALGREVVFLGDGVPVYREMLSTLMKVPYRYAPANMNRQRAASVAVLAQQYVKAGKTETAAEHAPDYLRLSQAERERAKAQKEER